MFNVVVEWMDEEKTRARFSLPGRVEWSARHVVVPRHLRSYLRVRSAPSKVPPILRQIVDQTVELANGA